MSSKNLLASKSPSNCNIPAKVLLKAALNVINFPYPQVCKHSVAADLLSILEEHGFPVDETFKDAAEYVVKAYDEDAVEALEKLIERQG